MIAVKRAIIPLILITLVAYIEIRIAVKKTLSISHFKPKVKFTIAIYTTSVIKL